MERLIRRNEQNTGYYYPKCFEEQPTAYNVENVVKQLEKEKITNITYKDSYAKGWNNAMQEAIVHIRNIGNTDVPETNVGNNGWIPASERLPNEEEMKQAYCRNHYGSEFIVMIDGASRPTTLYRTMDGFWVDEKRDIYNVVAWQPLPKPMQEKGVE